MEGLFGKTPTIEEVEALMEEVFGPEEDPSMVEGDLLAPGWVLPGLVGSRDMALIQMQALLHRRTRDGSIVVITAEELGGPIMQALQWAFILGANAERRGWDTDIHVVGKEDNDVL